MSQNLNRYVFVFQISDTEKPCIRRGSLSTLNSVFDPVGYISPAMISGKSYIENLYTWDVTGMSHFQIAMLKMEKLAKLIAIHQRYQCSENVCTYLYITSKQCGCPCVL